MQARIITLLDYEISKKVSEDCINQAAKFGINVEIFPAINGNQAQGHFERLEIKAFPSVKLSRGQAGCLLSHYYLYQLCLDLNEPLLILEHDGYLLEPIEVDIINQFDDVLKLDIFDPYSKTYEKKIEMNKTKVLEIRHDISKIYAKTKYGWYTWGAYAYILKPSGAKKLINKVKTSGYKKADHMLATDVVNISIPSKPLARLHPMYNSSNIHKLSLTNNLKNDN